MEGVVDQTSISKMIKKYYTIKALITSKENLKLFSFQPAAERWSSNTHIHQTIQIRFLPQIHNFLILRVNIIHN